MCQFLEQSSSPSSRRLYARTLGQIGDPSVEVVVERFERSAGDARAGYTLALGALEGKVVVSTLLEALEDPDHTVRREAVRALATKDDARARDALLRIALDDAEPTTRITALLGLGQARRQLDYRDLLQRIQSRGYGSLPEEEKTLLFMALGATGDEAVVEMLHRILKPSWIPGRQRREDWTRAASALARLGTSRAIQVLEEFSRSRQSGLALGVFSRTPDRQEGRPVSTQDGREERRRLELGRELIVNWTSLLRAVRLYENANATVLSYCERIRATARALIEQDDNAELTVRHDSIFVNGQRIRAGSVAARSYQRLISLLVGAGIGTMHVDDEAAPSELEVFARLLQTAGESRQDVSELVQELAVRGVSHVQVEAAKQAEELPEDLTVEQVARRVYLRSLSVVKNIFHEVRTSNRISARRVKRVVQGMIDSLESGADTLMHLTALKNYDEYTFNHSVNVSVLGIALGRHVGLTRRQLYIVGQAGMMHDLGKLSIPKELLNKPGRLTPEERERIQTHAVDGVRLHRKQARRLGRHDPRRPGRI